MGKATEMQSLSTNEGRTSGDQVTSGLKKVGVKDSETEENGYKVSSWYVSRTSHHLESRISRKPAMKILSLLLFALSATLSVIATRYTNVFNLYNSETPHESPAARLPDHLNNEWWLHVQSQSYPPNAMDHDTLRRDLSSDINHRRFLYLGHTAWGRPDMVLAVPLQNGANADRTHTWAILSVHKSENPKRPPYFFVHNYVKVSDGRATLARLAQAYGPQNGVLEHGQALTLEEVFDELKMLQPADWPH